MFLFNSVTVTYLKLGMGVINGLVEYLYIGYFEYRQKRFGKTASTANNFCYTHGRQDRSNLTYDRTIWMDIGEDFYPRVVQHRLIKNLLTKFLYAKVLKCWSEDALDIGSVHK